MYGLQVLVLYHRTVGSTAVHGTQYTNTITVSYSTSTLNRFCVLLLGAGTTVPVAESSEHCLSRALRIHIYV